ncbi:LysR family transcriptional regulator [Variovorax sp. GT1P44]|uniref:LysR family transcriptional regulator n=1 Tax=Variovorax sp. GT1P44 TaxID=3443742 RepID=UPI003F47DA14
MNDAELDLQHLQIFDILLAERNLTRCARVLNMTQPALSKMLARLRLYFGDPLFVRVALKMEPTPKALELAQPVRAILDSMRALRSDHVPFDPLVSERRFSFFMIDAAVVQLLPPLLAILRVEAPKVHVQAVPCDVHHLDQWLESGLVDLAIGSFASLTQGIRRHPLWTESYVSLFRKGHPRLDAESLTKQSGDAGASTALHRFLEEQHALVSVTGTGHEYANAERLLEATLPRDHIVCRVPTFAAAAHIARNSDIVATVPRTLGVALANDLDLVAVEPPLALPSMEIALYWHDRFHRDPGSQWLRGVFRRLFLRDAAQAA